MVKSNLPEWQHGLSDNSEQTGSAFLDEMLDTAAAAKWLKIKPRRLLADSKGPRAKIPAFWINRRLVRFHPRTIIAKFANDAGIPPEVIAAMFGLRETNPRRKPPTKTNERNIKN